MKPGIDHIKKPRSCESTFLNFKFHSKHEEQSWIILCSSISHSLVPLHIIIVIIMM